MPHINYMSLNLNPIKVEDIDIDQKIEEEMFNSESSSVEAFLMR